MDTVCSGYVDCENSQIDPFVNLHKLTMKRRKGLTDQFGNAVLDLLIHACKAFLPVPSVSASDCQNVGLSDITVGLHEVFQFLASEFAQQHLLLDIRRDLGIRHYQFREYGMRSSAFLASDAENT